MKVHLFASAAVILIAAGCSSTPEIPTTESFVTDITELGHRRFTYKATIGAGPKGQGSRRGGPGGGGPGGGPGGGKGSGGPGGGGPSGSGGPGGANSGDVKKVARQRMELLLAESGFCPNGWFLIEQTFDQNRAEIIGECRAVAR
ncbi:hypothetical protein ACJJIE_13610 [Microbulbifer sp. TRSA001]|uniref:hypothetical protein n=1 Tax=unclassified Microbulbifer TaxID=2619833 RepID=UPI0024AC8447|nr:hypothetical protein [Microbulbifer sp. VAAF005]WHI45545.1 hypothetical protein P0078_17695 [Microbulbifer sp. VAAF005]